MAGGAAGGGEVAGGGGTKVAEGGVLDVRGVEADDFLRLGPHALDPMPESDRHGGPRGLCLLWAGAQANFTSMLTGALVLSLGLGVLDGALAAIVGTLLAAVVLGGLSVL